MLVVIYACKLQTALLVWNVICVDFLTTAQCTGSVESFMRNYYVLGFSVREKCKWR
jgi:hypothetical protein